MGAKVGIMKRPHILILEDHPPHARLIAGVLDDCGLISETFTNIPSCLKRIYELWGDRTNIQQPGAIIIDQELPFHGHSGVEGSRLALFLREEIIAQHIHPIHLVAISASMTPNRQQMAQAAECSLVWEKPITLDMVEKLEAILMRQPSFTGQANPVIQALTVDALSLLRQEWERLQHVWDVQAVTQLIDYFRKGAQLEDEQAALASIQRLGGEVQTRLILSRCASQLPDTSAVILTKILGGYNASEIGDQMGYTRQWVMKTGLAQMAVHLASVLSQIEA